MFLLYLPGPLAGDKQQKLREAGLEAFTGDNCPTVEWREIVTPETGPDGGCGLLLRLCHGAKSPLDPPLSYRPDLQQWTPARPDPARGLAGGRYWMGRLSASQANAATELYCRRPRYYDSHRVKLLDGHEWLIPVARGLPRYLQLDEAGEWKRCVKGEHAAYWDASEGLFDAAVAGAAYKLEFALPYVLRGLALNYCLTPDLASWLGLLDDAVVMEAVSASFEWEQIRAILAASKKNEAVTADTSPIPDSPSPEPGAAGS